MRIKFDFLYFKISWRYYFLGTKRDHFVCMRIKFDFLYFKISWQYFFFWYKKRPHDKLAVLIRSIFKKKLIIASSNFEREFIFKGHLVK